jgi:hypothetical protein
LAKWKLFNRSKRKEESYIESGLPPEHSEESEEKPTLSETREESKKVPIKEYNETLYSKGSVQKQPTAPLPEKKQTLKRTSWESSETIEHNVDSMRRKQTESVGNSTQTRNDTDKKVDLIFLKKKGRS